MTRSVCLLASFAVLVAAAVPAAAQEPVSGELTAEDRLLPDGKYYHVYTLEASGGERVTIDLRSTGFDTYLILSSPSGRVLENDDHEGSLEHSRIETTLDEEGTWTVVVTSFAASRTGRYTVSARDATKNIPLTRLDVEFRATSSGEALFRRAQARYEEGTREGFEEAIGLLSDAVARFRASGARGLEGTTLVWIGVVHESLGRPAEALGYYEEALAISREVGDRPGEGTTLHNIGGVHWSLGRPAEALGYYEEALAISREVGDRPGEGATLDHIGSMHGSLGRPAEALGYYEEALAIRREVGDRPGEGTTLNNIGLMHGSLGRPAEALGYFEEALAIRREVGDRPGEGATLDHIAYLYYRSNPSQPLLAVAYYDSAAAVISQISAEAGLDEHRLSFAEQDVHLFRNWSLAWLDLAPRVGERTAHSSALAATERGRAQALLDLMHASAAQTRGEVGTASIATEPGRDLSQEGERLARSLAVSGSAAVSFLVTQDTLLTWLILPGGEIEVFRSDLSEQDLAQHVAALRSGLGADSAAVRDRMALRQVPLLEEARGLEGVDGSEVLAAEAAERLAAWLLPAELLELLPGSGELVVVPHGALNLLPFALLPLPGGGEPLGVRYALRYSPSLSTLAEIEERGGGMGAAEARAEAVVVGDPAMPEVRTASGGTVRLGRLSGALEEGRWVARQLGTQPLSGAEASESAVRERLPRATLVHLATHGYAYGTEALARESFVALAPDGAHDGLLTVGEVLDEVPSLSAELVVLSACQTGLGDLKQAEGTVGLQRAFLARGARSVLVSLWSVSDEATDLLMRSFYRHWLAGHGKAEALRRAQEEVRGEPGSRFHDPRYWSAFQLVGAG